MARYRAQDQGIKEIFPLSRFAEGAGLTLAGKALKCAFFPEGST
jgi:hypothetical protein